MVPLWRECDGPTPLRVAFSAGWNTLGDNWLIYPFFGSRLQNDVEWVPPTRDGALLDYRLARENLARFDAGAWVQRLLARRVDLVALQWPPTVEDHWVRALPTLFETIRDSPDGKHHLVRLRSEAARRWLADGAPVPTIEFRLPPARPR
jgi:hypothetical protein